MLRPRFNSRPRPIFFSTKKSTSAQLRKGDSEAILVPPPDPPASSSPVASFGAGRLGELWIRWRVYIFSTIVLVLGLGLESFSSFSGVIHVDGERVLQVVRGQEVHSDDFLCTKFGFGDFVFVSIFCVEARTFCVLLCVVYGFLINGIVESVLHDLAVVRRRLDACTGGVFTGILSLLGVFPWRLSFHLPLYAGRCSWILFVGLPLGDRSLPVLRLASVSGKNGICLARSTVKQYFVLLMGFNFDSVESGIGWKLHSGSSSFREMEEDQAAATKVGDGEGHWMLL